VPTNPFKNPDPTRIFLETDLVIGLWDAFPVSPGHALLIPRREVPTWFDASPEEQQALTEAITTTKEIIEQRHNPDGYNIGINAGAAAGQTVFHLHVHVIPRYKGDVEDPRGGVRHVIPSKANYLVKEAPTPTYDTKGTLVTGSNDPLLPHLKRDLSRARSVDLAVSFLQPSGLEQIRDHLEDLLFQRKGRCRVITGDYLDITHPDALETLLNLAQNSGGQMKLRVFLSSAAGCGFHPKAYLFANAAGERTAYVGSSNLSEAALNDSVEWNYRVDQRTDPRGLSEVQLEFEKLFTGPHTAELTYEWLAEYRKRRKPLPTRPVEILDDPAPEPATPHPIQEDALQALEQTRRQGNKAGLVVLATGLGKTWLSAFDSVEYGKVLFIAHREEILTQSMSTFRRIRPGATFGFYNGREKSPEADILFASIQTLSRTEHLEHFAPDQFEYIVVDEFHHADAPTYRRVIDYFDPQFLLGLTATPERTDGGNLLALCGQNLVYRCDLAAGIEEDLLCPMSYYGVPDLVDYSNIPWRSTRFDPEELTTALATVKRAENCIAQYRERAGSRTVAFCSTQKHSDFMAEQFREHKIRAVSVHSGPGTANRTESLKRLAEGELDVICCVDMFNEGLDLPSVDTVMMLRPTESRIIWLQQLGRGLRKAEMKERLTVIDYIGNHRSFRVKLETLVLELLKGKGRSDDDLRKVLKEIQYDNLDLPPGCEVTYDLEAVDILNDLLSSRGNGKERFRRHYLDLQESKNLERDPHLKELRPTALEMYQDGFDPRTPQDSWFEFVREMGDLEDDERAVLEENLHFFRALEKTPMNKTYKMVVLLAMIKESALPGRVELNSLTETFRKIVLRSERLRRDVEPHLGDFKTLQRCLKDKPLKAWTQGRGMGGESYFELDGEHVRTVNLSGDRKLFSTLVREIAEWRIAKKLDEIERKA